MAHSRAERGRLRHIPSSRECASRGAFLCHRTKFPMSRRHPYNGWLGTLAVSPCYQTASQGALDFLFVQVTIALDALLMPLKGRSYYFDSVPLKGSSYSFTLNLSCMIS